MKRWVCGFSILAIWLVWTAAARAAGDDLGREELEADHALSTDFVTPHTDWAQPYARGKTRVLFFCRGRNMEPRECVELMERFDIEAKAAFWSQIVDTTLTHWHGGTTGDQRILGLLGQRWDCFVFFDVAPKLLAAEAQYKLFSQVAAGSGLVLVGVDDPRALKEKNHLKERPWLLAAGPAGEAYTAGQGRAVRLGRRPAIEYSEGWCVDDDYWHERFGRAVLWAAGREPACRVEASVSKASFTRSAGGETITVGVSGKPTGSPARLELRVRSRYGEPIPWQGKELAPVGADSPDRFTPWLVTLPSLAEGEYHADVRLMSPAGVEAWTTSAFTVTSPRNVKEVTLTQDWGEVGQSISGTVTLEGPAASGEVLRVQLLDRRRRELARRDLPSGQSSVAFEFPVTPWMPMLVTVEAQLLDGRGEVSRRWRYYHVVKRYRDRYNFVMWDYPGGTLAPYGEEALARAGVTVHLSGNPKPPAYMAAFDIPYVPYTTRILSKEKTPQGIMKPFCWNDQAAVDKHIASLASRFVSSRQHGVFVYSLGDENETLGCCLSPYCERAYRAYLQECYGSLEVLNRSWQTSFASWDQVGLSKPDDNEEKASLETRNYARWFDRQAFKSYNYVKYCQKYAKAYAAIDPQSKTGFEGAGRFEHGDDLDLIVRSLEFWSPYPGLADEVIRSIAPRQMPRANWMGYTKDADSLLAKYWRMVTRGMDSVWWWRWDCIGRFHGWLAADLRPYPAVQEILDDTRIVREGLGDLLLKCPMHDDGVAILYSYPSTFAAKLETGPSYLGYEAAHARLHEALRSSGVQFRYVTDRMLRLGEFQASKTKIVFLARAEAMGDKEVEVLKQFVAGGGTLVADVRPGLYDEHCKPRSVGALDDLFQVTRGPQARAAKTGSAGLLVDPSVARKTPVPVAADAEIPPPVVVSHGRGKAILWNFSAASLMARVGANTPERSGEWFTGMLAQAGVRPAVQVLDATGKPVRRLEIVRWSNGGLELVALFREGGPADRKKLVRAGVPDWVAQLQLEGGQGEEVTVQLPDGPRFVTDLRRQASLGSQAKWKTTIRPNRPSWFVLAGKAPAKPQIGCESSTVSRGTTAKVTLAVPESEGLHALRIRVTAAGKPAEWLDQTVLVGCESKLLELPIALNDPTGRYEILVSDLVSGRMVRTEMQVR